MSLLSLLKLIKISNIQFCKIKPKLIERFVLSGLFGNDMIINIFESAFLNINSMAYQP